jgi:hypothetical protein
MALPILFARFTERLSRAASAAASVFPLLTASLSAVAPSLLALIWGPLIQQLRDRREIPFLDRLKHLLIQTASGGLTGS